MSSPKKFIACFASVFVLSSLSGCSPTLKDPVIEEAANALQASHINSKKVDWNRLRLQISLPPLAFNRDRAIDHMINELREPHTFRLSSTVAQSGLKDTADAGSVKQQLSVIRGYKIGDVAVVEVPTFMHSEPSALRAYAQKLFDSIAVLAEKQPRLWIIDLRGAGGGNMYPMLAGLSCFFDGDALGYFLDSSGRRAAWRVREEAAGVEFDGRWYPHVSVSGKCAKRLATEPVVVLTDRYTGSSSEAVAISFLSMQRTKIYGQRSAGFATANVPVPLSDGSLLLLTTSQMLDRSGKAFPNGIDPAEYVRRGAAVPTSMDSLKIAIERELTP